MCIYHHRNSKLLSDGGWVWTRHLPQCAHFAQGLLSTPLVTMLCPVDMVVTQSSDTTNCVTSLQISLRDIVSYAVICRVCPRHGMQIHIQTCTCADQYTYSYLDMSMSSAVCRWVLLGLSIGCVLHPYREQQFSP